MGPPASQGRTVGSLVLSPKEPCTRQTRDHLLIYLVNLGSLTLSLGNGDRFRSVHGRSAETVNWSCFKVAQSRVHAMKDQREELLKVASKL